MPKRRNRSSYSVSPRKSPRKSNNVAGTPSSGGDKEGKDEEETEPVQPVIFQFDVEDGVEEMEISPKDLLMCLTGEECENENQMPSDNALETESVGNRSLQQLVSNVVSTPLKRASPLSPTLLDNVQQHQILPASVITPAEPTLLPSSDPSDVPKIDSDYDSSSVTNVSVGSPRSRRKRRRLYSDSTITATDDASTSEVPPKDDCAAEQLPSTDVLHPHYKKRPSQHTSKETDLSTVRIELPKAVFSILEDYDKSDMVPPMVKDKYLKWVQSSKEELCKFVTYELDEVDMEWLVLINKLRQKSYSLDLGQITFEEMELLMDRMEKEHYFELQNSGIGEPGESDEDAVCCICLIGDSDNSNQIIFCDLCNIPVHQDCYGVPFIPEGSWLCRRCHISPHGEIECIFCPVKDGALKQTVDGRWAHVLCALWIPEVRFSNPSLVEPVDDIDDIPPARWRLTCFLCKMKGVGACIQCHLRSCVTAFHPTCAQAAGLSLKLETRESTGAVRLSASCDKHTSQRDRSILKQKWETINKVLNEKRLAPAKAQFNAIPSARLSAVFELVTFPGKQIFKKKFYAYWKLKRKDKGGAPLIRNLESLWIQGLQFPPAPDPLLRPPPNNEFIHSCYEKMKTFQLGLTTIKEYCSLVKSYSEAHQADIDARIKIATIQMQMVDPIYLQVIEKLKEKDKHMVFFEPVTEEDAPGYHTIITHPMDFSTMKKKVIELQYSCIEELEADFQLMINNCVTFNKKSTMYHKDAIKLHEHSILIFHEAKMDIEQREKDRIAEEERQQRKKLVQATLPGLFIKQERTKDLKFQPLNNILNEILEQLEKYDKNEIFAEPVHINEVPDYLDVIKDPMDFQTMRTKINSNLYFCIEDLEKDFEIMINNCLEYNEDDSDFYKEGVKMRKYGQKVFSKVKEKSVEVEDALDSNPELVGEIKTENNNNEKFNGESIMEASIKKEAIDTTLLYEVLGQVLAQLKDRDEEKVFWEPVSLDEVPNYLEVIKNPMDLSTMESKLKSFQYASLEDLEEDFNLMINNCKEFNPPRSDYYGIAKLMKSAGDKYFRAARRKLQPR